MKIKIQIKSLVGNVLFELNKEDNTLARTLEQAVKESANLWGADLWGADLWGANLESANLWGANLRGAKEIPQSYINICSRDMLFIFQSLKKELPFLRKALIEGRVNGSQYEGECACLIGTLANADGGLDKVCGAIPFYEMGLHNPGEQWFYQIREGDKPENSFFAKHALTLIDKVLKKRK